MRDLTSYSDDELSLHVFNEEYFYIERENRDYLLALVKEEFYYTTSQMTTLIKDLEEDSKETKSIITPEQQLDLFKVDLITLLEKHKASLDFMMSDCSDTHGISEEGFGVSFGGKVQRLTHGYCADSNDIKEGV